MAIITVHKTHLLKIVSQNLQSPNPQTQHQLLHLIYTFHLRRTLIYTSHYHTSHTDNCITPSLSLYNPHSLYIDNQTFIRGEFYLPIFQFPLTYLFLLEGNYSVSVVRGRWSVSSFRTLIYEKGIFTYLFPTSYLLIFSLPTYYENFLERSFHIAGVGEAHESLTIFYCKPLECTNN